jgi:hypothetical protein
MAALGPTSLYTAQNSSLTNGADRPNLASYGGRVHVLQTSYTLLGTEAAADTLLLAYLPKGATLLRHLSYVECLDPGTTLTLDIGTTSDADIYADGIVLSSGGGVAFSSAVAGAAGNLVRTTTTDETAIQATVASANTLSAGVILYFTLAYSTPN